MNGTKTDLNSNMEEMKRKITSQERTGSRRVEESLEIQVRARSNFQSKL